MATAANLGFPRLGVGREWKKATEAYWAGKSEREVLAATAASVRARHWALQTEAGIGVIPAGDFADYDLVLDTAAMVGAVPPRFALAEGAEVDVDTAFAMGRGRQDAPAMEMTKWFDTNYHYIVPELSLATRFRLASDKVLRHYEEARARGVEGARPVLLGPASFLLLSKTIGAGVNKQDFVEALVGVYAEMLRRLAQAGAAWVQIDEPTLVLDLTADEQRLFRRTWELLQAVPGRPKLLVATYFGSIAHHLELALGAGEGLHLDLVRAPEQLDLVLERDDGKRILSLGVVDGRNIWRNDLESSLALLRRAAAALGGHERLQVAPSCSLLHSPIDLDAETALDPEIRSWMAFGKQKLQEVAVLVRGLEGGDEAIRAELTESRQALTGRRRSTRVHNPEVARRVAAIDAKMTTRRSPFAQRSAAQRAHLQLPELPTTTIGSFPQTKEVRRLRAALKSGELTAEGYRAGIEAELIRAVRIQEELGLDVLVHGEFERNDMVEYFGEQLEGYVFTSNGWVQSYGSRAVKPPIIFGDVWRPRPMTVDWSSFAQKQTAKPMKGMLTGPVTMLQWSFVRDDQPRAATCRQLALAIRDEVVDLEAAGIRVIQIDEPAFREGLPLRRGDWAGYLAWAVEAFRVSASGVDDRTQIHTHMCYSEFNAIFDAIAALDADVISIEASRSRMELLDAFDTFGYPNDIGPGIYDIHSPRIPDELELVALLEKAMKHVPAERLWVNPDCGLKTRGWPEVEAALRNLVAAARGLRSRQARSRSIEGAASDGGVSENSSQC